MVWKPYGEGRYNWAYIDDTRTSIFKLSKTEGPTDTPERSVRIWNEINGHLPFHRAYVSVEVLPNGLPYRGWVSPYIEGQSASDEEISQALIDIYSRTGRVIVDGMARDNFIKAAQGHLVCVDVGLALMLQENTSMPSVARGHVKKPSATSLDFWKNKPFYIWMDYFLTCLENDPISVRTIKALLFINAQQPNRRSVEFLRNNNRPIIEQLAEAYDIQYTALPVCKARCESYLHQFFSNKRLPLDQGLQNAIRQADSFKALKDIMPPGCWLKPR